MALRKFAFQSTPYSAFIKRTFLTNAYSCTEAWSSRSSTPILSKVNLNDFYNLLDQSYSSKGVISATDVDIFANAIKDANYLDELRDLLHKLRLSAETGSTLQSTHHATVRNYIDFGNIQDLLEILKDPLNYGIFLDNYTSNILLNKLITSENYEEAATVSFLIMLQEEYTNEITSALCQYACYKFVQSYTPPPPVVPEKTNKKPEEIKIRVKFLRNPYYDDHFDVKDSLLLAGKTMAWLSESKSDNLSLNLQLAGWFLYKKYDKLYALCEKITKNDKFKLYAEVKDILAMKQNSETTDADVVSTNEKCLSSLNKLETADTSLEEALKVCIENAINMTQKEDIHTQQQLFKSWAEIREAKLNEQIQRLDRAKRIERIQEKQDKMKEEEQKLWFFENEEKIDLVIEEKEKLTSKAVPTKQTAVAKTDENYIPPEILPRRK